MHRHEPLYQNVRFLLIEVQKQVRRTTSQLKDPNPERFEAVRASDDYIDNLKAFVQTECFEQAALTDSEDRLGMGILRALQIVAMNLERISDFCERVIEQLSYIEQRSVLEQYDLGPLFRQVQKGLSNLKKAIEQDDLRAAIRVCHTEQQLDTLYASLLGSVLESLAESRDVQSHVTVLFISHYLERMGDSLLNSGEALLSARVGEPIKFRQLEHLEEALLDVSRDVRAVAMKELAPTKSGAKVARIVSASQANSPLIFKEGKTKKLAEERAGIARWQSHVPGLAPDIYSFQEEGERSAMLYEYLPGRTFEQLLLRAGDAELNGGLDHILHLLGSIWTQTRNPTPAYPGFMAQLSKRLEDIRAVHPKLLVPSGSIHGVEFRSYTELLQSCAIRDTTVYCPFSVLIHGDFNVDNLIYNSENARVRFIDLHRSTFSDYCQDISVFLVSNIRLQAFEKSIQRRLSRVIDRVIAFARDFASEQQDTTFDLRLSLGLARSLATSTRFVLDRKLARTMFLKSRYLLETVADYAGVPERFRLPEAVLR